MPVSIPEPKSGPVHLTETLRDVGGVGHDGLQLIALPGTASPTAALLTRQEPSGCSRAADHLLRTGITPIAILGGEVVNQFEVGKGRFHPSVPCSLWPLAAGLGERLDQPSDQRMLAARRGRRRRELG